MGPFSEGCDSVELGEPSFSVVPSTADKHVTYLYIYYLFQYNPHVKYCTILPDVSWSSLSPSDDPIGDEDFDCKNNIVWASKERHTLNTVHTI